MRDSSSNRDYHFARVVIVRPGRPSNEAQADRCAIFRHEDLAILHVSGFGDLANCGQPFVGQANIDSLLGVSNDVSLAVANESGQHQNIPLVLRAVGAQTVDVFFVEPKSDAVRLTGGMSGGLVFVGDNLAGMLLSIPTDDTRTGRDGATVLRIDRLATLVTRYFDSPASFTEVDTPGCQALTANTPSPTYLPGGTGGQSASSKIGNLALEACGAQVTGWSVPTLRAEYRPDNLLGRGGPNGQWQAFSDGDADVDIQLCPSKLSTISSVRVSTTGCAPGANVDATVEVLVRAGRDTNYSSLGYARLSVNGDTTISSGSPMVGAQVRLRFQTPQKGTLCVGPLQIK
jgi:hypothetical protein